MDHTTGHIRCHFRLPWLLKSNDIFDIFQIELFEQFGEAFDPSATVRKGDMLARRVKAAKVRKEYLPVIFDILH